MSIQPTPVDPVESEAPRLPAELHPHGGDWLRDIVFGLNDGLVTKLVFLMAVSELAPQRPLLSGRGGGGGGDSHGPRGLSLRPDGAASAGPAGCHRTLRNPA